MTNCKSLRWVQIQLVVFTAVSTHAQGQATMEKPQISTQDVFVARGIEYRKSDVRQFAVEIINHSEQPIEAITIQWLFTNAYTNRPDKDINVRYRQDDKPMIPVGGHQVFWPNIAPDSLKPKADVTVAIDGVLLTTGEIIGKNEFGLDKHVQLRKDCEKFVLSGYLSRHGEQRSAWLASFHRQPEPKGSTHTIGGSAYWRWSMLRNYSEVINRISSTLGEPATVRFATERLRRLR